MKVTGKFEVKLSPLDTYAENSGSTKVGRMSINKTFYGALTATSVGEMLNALSPVEGSAGYVAIEKVTGELDGKSGSFILQHYGVLNGSEKSLVVEVVPDSGIDDLVGLKGKMNIRIEDGQHYYDFDYEM